MAVDQFCQRFSQFLTRPLDDVENKQALGKLIGEISQQDVAFIRQLLQAKAIPSMINRVLGILCKDPSNDELTLAIIKLINPIPTDIARSAGLKRQLKGLFKLSKNPDILFLASELRRSWSAKNDLQPPSIVDDIPSPPLPPPTSLRAKRDILTISQPETIPESDAPLLKHQRLKEDLHFEPSPVSSLLPPFNPSFFSSTPFPSSSSSSRPRSSTKKKVTWVDIALKAPLTQVREFKKDPSSKMDPIPGIHLTHEYPDPIDRIPVGPPEAPWHTPYLLDRPSSLAPYMLGHASKQSEIQRLRELKTIAVFYAQESRIPKSPYEPEVEKITSQEESTTKIIPEFDPVDLIESKLMESMSLAASGPEPSPPSASKPAPSHPPVYNATQVATPYLQPNPAPSTRTYAPQPSPAPLYSSQPQTRYLAPQQPTLPPQPSSYSAPPHHVPPAYPPPYSNPPSLPHHQPQPPPYGVVSPYGQSGYSGSQPSWHGKQICKFFLANRCHNGSQCKFLHEYQ